MGMSPTFARSYALSRTLAHARAAPPSKPTPKPTPELGNGTNNFQLAHTPRHAHVPHPRSHRFPCTRVLSYAPHAHKPLSHAHLAREPTHAYARAHSLARAAGRAGLGSA